jgi:sterol desaturase/sphingolipid hydroxylase (fatty acid hydroxylase superfamily)
MTGLARTTVRYGYAPLLLIGVNGLAVLLTTRGASKTWLPLILLGLPAGVTSVLALAMAVQLLLQHSNADYRVGQLRYVLALNEGHRFHHLKRAGIGDVSLGLFTLVWDHALGTFSYDPGRRFDSAQLGMAAKPDYPMHYLPQLLEPFRASGACDPASAAQPSVATSMTKR